MDGIINIKKEKGYTSHDVVAKLRGILRQKKIGHTGTLDPDATGVLPVCLGRGTKVCELLTDKNKTYVATVQLGVLTDTEDMTGEILERRQVDVTKEMLEEVISQFQGEIWQTPPMYSAIKVNGKRLYELARKGEVVERKQRKITIFRIALLDFDETKQQFVMEVECSKGTYIRTLCKDMGEALGCGAAMANLVRTKVDMFTWEDAHTLQEVETLVQEGTVSNVVYPIESVFCSYSEIVVKKEGLHYLLNGNLVREDMCQIKEVVQDKEKVRMKDENGFFYAIYQYEKAKKQFANVKMFYNELQIK